MAITILNVTHHDVSTSGNTNSTSIPATSVGSTLIVLVSTKSGASGFIGADNIQDDEAIFGSYTKVSSASTSSKPSVSLAVDVFYRAGVPAGLTTINTYYSYNSVSSYVTVIEAAGVNVTSPVETGNTKTTTATTNNPVGNSTTTAFTNALFVGVAVTTTNNMNTLNNSWTNDNVEIKDHKHGHRITSGSTTMSISNTTSNAQTYIVGTAVFNPTPNAFTLDLDDTITADSDIGNAAGFEKSASDSISFADSLDAVLSTLNHFKNLADTLLLADSFSAVISFFRNLSDTLTLTDSIAFVHASQRVLTDALRLQDWLSVKRFGNHWGN